MCEPCLCAIKNYVNGLPGAAERVRGNKEAYDCIRLIAEVRWWWGDGETPALCWVRVARA